MTSTTQHLLRREVRLEGVSLLFLYTYIYIYIYIYIYMDGIRPICRLHFGQTFQNFPIFIVKNGPEKWTPKRAKNAFFVVLNSSMFPTEKGKLCCFS